MENIIVPIVIALVGVLGSIGAGALAGRRQARLQRDAWRRETSDAFAAELRSTVKELTTKLAEAAHSMVWLCWSAKFGPDRLTQERIDQYDQEMHALLPEILGQHAVVAGMDRSVYLALSLLVRSVFEMDGTIGRAGLEFVPGESESAKSLSEKYEDALDLESRLSKTVANAIASYAVPTEHQEDVESP
jgi:hypothetical protein